jgi:hypothetical protein
MPEKVQNRFASRSNSYPGLPTAGAREAGTRERSRELRKKMPALESAGVPFARKEVLNRKKITLIAVIELQTNGVLKSDYEGSRLLVPDYSQPALREFNPWRLATERAGRFSTATSKPKSRRSLASTCTDSTI